MKIIRMKQYTYYLFLGVMAYLSLAYYIHFRVQQKSSSRGFYIEHVPNRNLRESQQNGGTNGGWKSDNYFGDYPNYYGADYNNTEVIQEFPENKSDFLKIENFKFQNVKFQKIQDLYVYGVYLDKRIENKTFVRIFVLQMRQDLESLLCHFTNKSNSIIVSAEKYEMCENHGKKYGGYIYSCHVPEFIGMDTLDTISLSTFAMKMERHPQYITTGITPLQQKSNLDIGKMFFGVCLPPLFGHIAINILVQYIEMTKILGASKLLFYNYNVSKNVEKLLKYYSLQGDIEVINWNIPGHIKNHEIWYNGQLLAIQDCLYRNMGRFQFLLFADLDELLIPRQANNWITMLHNIGMNLSVDLNHVAGLSFQSVFFDPNQTPDSRQTVRLLQFLQRSKTPSSVRRKLFVQPMKIFELGIHHVSRPISDNLTVVDVRPDEALLHHYRKCVKMFDAKMQCFPEVQDETILKYAVLLKTRTTDVMSNVSRLFY